YVQQRGKRGTARGLSGRRRWQFVVRLGQEPGARRRQGVQSGWQGDRLHSAARARRQRLLRRPLPQPAVHGGEPLDLFALREHAGRGWRVSTSQLASAGKQQPVVGRNLLAGRITSPPSCNSPWQENPKQTSFTGWDTAHGSRRNVRAVGTPAASSRGRKSCGKYWRPYSVAGAATH